MTRTVINGKVMRTPTLSRYDGMVPKPAPAGTVDLRDPFEFNQQFVKEGPSTRPRDKALLVSLGVDGDVPLAQARINAGLDEPYPDPDGGTWVPRWLAKKIIPMIRPANDNHKIAAQAA